MELDAIDALALTLHHAPGVESLLVGSGISRAAGIPTGWEITLDLIRRLAAVQGVGDCPDPLAWHRAVYNREPSYSELLDSLAQTPSERRSILQTYIESAEGEESRRPTKAHRAIADLVAAGAIRVIVTTNFDRLIESALRDVGVEPTVIASDDALLGAVPLVHARCTLIKVHGDYMDDRIRNTDDELEHYSPAMNALLDRVFDEYGSIVVGWSGEWDTALRAAILRSKGRRYPLYWAARGAPAPLAEDLIVHRAGRVIAVDDADTFLGRVASKLEALRSLDRVHPQSVALTVAEGKRLCRDPVHAIEWSDLLATEIARYRDLVFGPDFAKTPPTKTSVNDIVALVVARTEALRRLVLVGVRWGADEAVASIVSALRGLYLLDEGRDGYTVWIAARRLAAALCFHWAAAGALLREDPRRLARIFQTAIPVRHEKSKAAVRLLPIKALDMDWKGLAGLERHYTPHSEYFAPIFVQDARDVVLSDRDAHDAWDDTEFWISIESGAAILPDYRANRGWFGVPTGRYVWQYDGTTLRDRLARLRALTELAPEFQAGLLGGSPEAAKDILDEVESYLDRVAGSWH